MAVHGPLLPTPLRPPEERQGGCLETRSLHHPIAQETRAVVDLALWSMHQDDRISRPLHTTGCCLLPHPGLGYGACQGCRHTVTLCVWMATGGELLSPQPKPPDIRELACRNPFQTPKCCGDHLLVCTVLMTNLLDRPPCPPPHVPNLPGH